MTDAPAPDFHQGFVDVWNDLEGVGVLISTVRPDGVWFHYTALAPIFGATGRWLRTGDPVQFAFEDVNQDGFFSRALEICALDENVIALRQFQDSSLDGSTYVSRLKLRRELG